MKPLETVYWLRFALGFVAALVSIGYGAVTNTITTKALPLSAFMNGMSLALIVYLISYYFIKFRFKNEVVEKPRKLVTMGIGAYFLAWMLFWVLLYTIIAGPM